MTDPTICETCGHPWSEHRPRPVMQLFGWWVCGHPVPVPGHPGRVTTCGCGNTPPARERNKQGRQ